MSDRESLIAAIEAHSAEDTPRLVFADYLDEANTSDWDRATAEFIRLTCTGSARVVRAKLWLKNNWLKNNWHRLIPSLFWEQSADQVIYGQSAPVKGDRVFFRMRQRLLKNTGGLTTISEDGVWENYHQPFWIKFERGFVSAATFQTEWTVDRAMSLLRKDQPLAMVVVVRTNRRARTAS